MCEVLGFSSRRRRNVNAHLREFFSHGEENPHGWGLALYTADGTPSIEKEPLKSTVSSSLASKLETPLETNQLIAHIRLATIGSVEYVNCHPFVQRDVSGRTWVFVHNGTIFDYPALNAYVPRQAGWTDSERLLLFLMDEINQATAKKGLPLEFAERFEVIERVLAELATRNNKLNILVSDGEYLYAHTNYRDSLFVSYGDESVLLSTHPLTDDAWENLPFTSLCAFKDGELVRRGRPHGGEYIINQRDLDMIYVGFSEL